MALGDPAILCVNPAISLDELIKSALVITSTGIVGLRTVTVTVAADDIDPHPGCADPSMDAMQAIRNMFGLTTAGETALVLIQES